jgi:hypothetical protein
LPFAGHDLAIRADGCDGKILSELHGQRRFVMRGKLDESYESISSEVALKKHHKVIALGVPEGDRDACHVMYINWHNPAVNTDATSETSVVRNVEDGAL